MDLSLGEWEAFITQWKRAHNPDDIAPPSAGEFETAIMKARGVNNV